MGLRFRQRVKICPGLYINIGLGGLSVTAGVRGASMTLGQKGAYLNAGIPGTGVSFRQKIDTSPHLPLRVPDNAPQPSSEGEIHSADVESITSVEFADAKEMLLKTYAEQRRLRTEITSQETSVMLSKVLRGIAFVLLIGFVMKWFKNNVELKVARLKELQTALDDCLINLDITLDPEREGLFQKMAAAYKEMASSARIWQMTNSSATDRFHDRTLAHRSIARTPVQFEFGKTDILKCSHDAFLVQTTSGLSIFIYPAFVLLRSQNGDIGIAGFREIDFKFVDQRFIEEEGTPSDTKQIGTTWKKVNKDGGPDRRFKGNYQIPIVLYGEFSLQSKTGLNECFMVSNNATTKTFSNAFLAFQKAIASHDPA
jgi:hypothetical protein